MTSKVNLIPLFILLSGCSLLENKINLVADDVAYVYDGDSITFHCIDGYICENNKTKVRVKGVDTPEIKAKCQQERDWAREAKQHTVGLLRAARQITLVVDTSEPYDKYKRLLAYVYIDDLGLHDSLIRHGLGRSYEGGQRETWC